MAEVRIRRAERADAVELVVKMRQADVDELAALGIVDTHTAVCESIERSAFCYTATAGDELACIFGVAPLGSLYGDEGIPWMLGTDHVRRHQRVLMRLCHPYIRQMLSVYPHLMNYVHAENDAAKRWLKCVGFTLQPPVPFGNKGALFHRFDMRA